MEQKKISVIVPIYNTEKYLRRCIESIINQTYNNLEIILINDGSNDCSGNIVDEYAKQDSRIIPIHQENSGVSSARNAGLKVATGEYIGFVDGDDWIETNMYKKMSDIVKRDMSDIVICGYFIDDDHIVMPIENKTVISEDVFGLNKLLRYVFIRDEYKSVAAYLWNKIFKKDILLNSNELILCDESYKIGEDVLWFSKVALNAKKISYIDSQLYHYVQRQDSEFHSKNVLKRYDSIRVYKRIINEYKRLEIGEEIIIYIKRFLVYHAMNIAKLAYQQEDENMLSCCQSVMREYEREYMITNEEYKERKIQFLKVLEYRVRSLE